MGKTVLVTGARGFVGKSLCNSLICNGLVVRAIERGRGGTNQVVTIDGDTSWQGFLAGTDFVIHLAAKLQPGKEGGLDPLSSFRQTNVAGTLNLAQQAAQAGVKRFIFISSIKVNGEQTLPGFSFSAEQYPAPEDPYGLSKWEAEQGLLAIAHDSGMEVVIIRPPLIYGPGVKGNFAAMIKLVEGRLPLPLGRLVNRRSLLGIDNLISLIMTCLYHPAAANQVFLASDGEDLSTSDLLQRLSKAAGRSSKLIPAPAGLLNFGLRLIGKKKMAQRLVGSLQVDISKTRDLLSWSPPLSVDEGLRRCFASRIER